MSCPECFKGAIRTDTKPFGTIAQIHNRPTYIAEPPVGSKPKGIIVIVSDAFGWDLPNNRILADEFARDGNFKVYLPDFMDGTAVPVRALDSLDSLLYEKSWKGWFYKPWHLYWVLTTMVPWTRKNRVEVSMPKVEAFLQGVRGSGEEGKLPIGVAGYCWGAMHVVRLAVPDEEREKKGELPLADVLFTAHPSNLKIPQDFERIRRPISIGNGSNDVVLKNEALMKAVEVLKKNDVKHEFVEYEGARHGFAVRLDRRNKKQAEQADECEKQAVNWFTERFAEIQR